MVRYGSRFGPTIIESRAIETRPGVGVESRKVENDADGCVRVPPAFDKNKVEQTRLQVAVLLFILEPFSGH